MMIRCSCGPMFTGIVSTALGSLSSELAYGPFVQH